MVAKVAEVIRWVVCGVGHDSLECLRRRKRGVNDFLVANTLESGCLWLCHAQVFAH